MSTKRTFWVVALVFIAAVVALALSFFGEGMSDAMSGEEDEVHLHAGFIVYDETGRRDFSAPVYMSSVPCEAPDDPSEGYIQLHKAHLHDNIGDVVHVHRENATWGDLFENMGVAEEFESVALSVSSEEALLEESEALSQEIRAGESVVFFVNGVEATEERLSERVSSEKIEMIGNMSESCS